MRVKKYRAPDRATALKQIRAEMGPDAMILQEQRVRPGPMGLFGKPEIEIMAAVEEPEGPAGAFAQSQTAAAPTTSDDGEVRATISSAGRRAAGAPSASVSSMVDGTPSTPPADGASRLAAILAELPKGADSISPEVASRLADVIAQSADGSLEELLQAGLTKTSDTKSSDTAPTLPLANGRAKRPEAEASAPSAPSAASAPSAVSSAPPPSASSGVPSAGMGLLHEMQRTLTDLRTAVDRINRQTSLSPASSEPPALRTLYQRLMDQEVDPGLALELMGNIADELKGDQSAGATTVRTQLAQLIESQLPTRSLASQFRATRRPHVVVLVGPTGVGKTTTVAKLAAHLSLQETRRVCLVTTDTFRIAAAAQLGTYADIMRLPLEVVYSPDELPAAINKHEHADVVIVDTPGCGQHNEPQLRELASYVNAAVGAAPAATVLLAVSAPTKLSDMLEVQERFGALPLDGLILTKLDETRALGPMLSLVRRAGKPVYFVTIGQNVPNDIEPADAHRIVTTLLGESAATPAYAPVGVGR